MNIFYFGIGAALTSAIAWALGSILFKQIGEKISPLGLTLSKGIIGVILLGITYIFVGFEHMLPIAVVMLLLSGVIGISVGDTLFFASLQDLGPKIQIIFFMLGQVMTALLALIILREKLLLIQWIGILVTLSGVAVVLWKKIFSYSEKNKTYLRGIINGFLAMLSFSISFIIAKRAMNTVSPLGAALIRMLGGTLGILIYGLVTRGITNWLNPFREKKLISQFLLAVGVVTFGGFWLSLVSIKILDIAVASTLGATEPLFILPLAYFLLKEKVHISELAGAGLTVIGVTIIILGSTYWPF